MLSKFLRFTIMLTFLFGLGLQTGECRTPKVKAIKVHTPKRDKGQTDVIELKCAPIDTVRIGVIGLGNRGIGAVRRLTFIPTAKIVAVCDVQQRYVDRAQRVLKKAGFNNVASYNGEEDWKKVCERDDIDLIYVATHWDLHTPVAVYAMEHGKHVAAEVPIAQSLEECWALVNTAEKTRRHCMQLENCNYDFFELSTINMAHQGLFGEILHAEGAYIHDLRGEFFYKNFYWQDWRLRHNTDYNGNLYPTHGFGPIAHAMNLHRGDRMVALASMSSKQRCITELAEKKFGKDSEQAKREYKHGDMNTSIIRTMNGRTMMIQHDVTTPRPYSRHHLLNGTKGFAQKYPSKILAFDPHAHYPMKKEQADSLLNAYQFPFVKAIREKALKVGGHGGMDFIMDYRLIYCLNHGLPLDLDVYDGVEASCLVGLTQLSVENGGALVEVPDFTRGAWKKLDKITYYE